MSFASLCKEELMKKKRNVIENKALILGMILSGAKISDAEFVFSSVSEAISKYLIITFVTGLCRVSKTRLCVYLSGSTC